MKKLGLIGGIGPESTVQYYQQIIKLFRKTLATTSYPLLTIESIDMTQMLGYVNAGRLEELTDFLLESIDRLVKNGAQLVAMASNTPHIVFDRLIQKTDVPLVSIVVSTCAEIKRQQISSAGLFGTRSTMNAGFYKEVALRENIEIYLPNEEEQSYIHDKYFSELVFNKIVPSTRKALIEIGENLRARHGIEGLILGGTELPLILDQSDYQHLSLFNTTEIHVKQIVEKIIEA